jgi:hypothetical protein
VDLKLHYLHEALIVSAFAADEFMLLFWSFTFCFHGFSVHQMRGKGENETIPVMGGAILDTKLVVFARCFHEGGLRLWLRKIG